jgi:hypothetical protein
MVYKTRVHSHRKNSRAGMATSTRGKTAAGSNPHNELQHALLYGPPLNHPKGIKIKKIEDKPGQHRNWKLLPMIPPP